MTLKPYLQLVRLPNVFTAAADGLAGWLLVRGTLAEPRRWVPLVLASACVYAGGIVLNDVFDVEVDRLERPDRPLPSGRVGYRFAVALGVAFLAAGLALAYAWATRHGLVVAAGLVACVLAYDAGLRRTPLGPEVMGACRGLNLLLGMSAAADLGGPVGWVAAASYGLYVTGVTWISRAEVDAGRFKPVAAGAALQIVAFAGLILASTELGQTLRSRQIVGCFLLIGLAIAVDRRAYRAILSPTPEVIQGVVKFDIMTLVWLHVGLLLALRGPEAAAAVAAFWFPAAYSGRWIYST